MLKVLVVVVIKHARSTVYFLDVTQNVVVLPTASKLNLARARNTHSCRS